MTARAYPAILDAALLHVRAREQQRMNENHGEHGHFSSGDSSALATTDKSGAGVMKDAGTDHESYAGVTAEEWETWTQDSANVQEAMAGTLKVGEAYSDADGSKLSAADIANLKDIGDRVQKAAELNGINASEVFRGDAFKSEAAVKEAFPHNALVTFDKLTPAAVERDVADEYAIQGVQDSNGEHSFPVVFRVSTSNGVVQGIQPAPASTGAPSAEFVLPQGGQYRVAERGYESNGRYVVRLYQSKPPAVKSVVNYAAGSRSQQRMNENHDEHGKFASADGGSYAPALNSSAAQQAVHMYARNGYKEMNSYLRTGEVAASAATSSAHSASYLDSNVASLDRVIASTQPLAEEKTVYRGVGSELLPSLAIGATVTDAGFMSTSENKNVGKLFAAESRVMLQIAVPAGAKALEFGKISNSDVKGIRRSEKEVLLPRGSGVRITSSSQIKYQGQPLTLFKGEYIPPAATRSQVRMNENHDEHGKFASADSAAAVPPISDHDLTYYVNNPGQAPDSLKNAPLPPESAIAAYFSQGATFGMYQAAEDYVLINRGYKDIQYAARTGEGGPALKEKVDMIDKLVALSPVTEHATMMFRGIDAAHGPPLEVGATVKDNGFVSTTTDFRVAEMFSSMKAGDNPRAILQISIPKGTRMLDVAAAGLPGNVNERILPRGGTFKVTSIEKGISYNFMKLKYTPPRSGH